MTEGAPELRKQIHCPGECGSTIHVRALVCPYCGYRARITGYHGLFQSLSVAGSILLGFTINGLVTLAIESTSAVHQLEPHQQWIVYAVSSIWAMSSVLLFLVLLFAEVTRHVESSESPMQMSFSEEHRLRRKCDRLLWVFVIGGFLMFVGMIVLAFYFSIVNGLVGLLAIIFSLIVVIPKMR